MDIFLGRLTSQAMNYAIRSGITITTGYAIKQCSQLLKETTTGSRHREELQQLQARLESKIRILSPAIDMIELISARGNTTLESAVVLTKAIRAEMQKLGMKTAQVVEEESHRKNGPTASTASKDSSERAISNVIASIQTLLDKIEDAIPLINLAITTSGVNLSTKLSGTISPSRLLQASTFLTAADTKFTAHPNSRQQVGPTWTLSLYMLFTGHANRAADEDGMRDATWKEVMHKAKVKLVRVPLDEIYELLSEDAKNRPGRRGVIPGESKSNEFAYQLVVIEDLDDDRVHTFDNEDEESPSPFEDVLSAGIRDVVPIHEVSKIFYADTGKILNIGSDDEINNPVLLLKRDVHADEPRMMLRRSTSQVSNRVDFDEKPEFRVYVENDGDMDEQSEIDAQIHRESTPNTEQHRSGNMSSTSSQWRLPMNLDPEWLAFEVYTEASDSESDSEEPSQPTSRQQRSLAPDITSAMSHLKLKSPSPQPSPNGQSNPIHESAWPISPFSKLTGPRIKTSLSLLEMLIKLAALQQFRQDTHLAIEDELLNFFLEDSATAGAGADREFRQRLRHDAVRRVGFDPYDESPVKKRGEEYIAHKRGKASPRGSLDVNAFHGRLPNGVRIGGSQVPTPESVVPSIEHRHSSPITHYPSPSPLTAAAGQMSSRNSLPTTGPVRDEMAPKATAALNNTLEALPGHLLSTTGSVVPKFQWEFARAQSEPQSRSPLAKEFPVEDD